jgi:hypothetical protein
MKKILMILISITFLFSLSTVSYAIPKIDLSDIIRDACDGFPKCALKNMDFHNRGVHPYMIFWAISRFHPRSDEDENALFKNVVGSVATAYGKAGYSKYKTFSQNVANKNYTRDQYISYWNKKIKRETDNSVYLSTDGGCVFRLRQETFC